MTEPLVLRSRLELMEALRKTVIRERAKLAGSFNWNPENDIRLRMFDQIDNLIRPYSLTLLFYEDHLANDQYLTAKVQPATPKDAQDVRSTYLVFVQNAYIYNLTGVVEGALRSVLRVLGPNDKAASDFKRVKANLLAALGGGEPEHTRDAVTLLFMIRNCIHNNGAHFSRDGADEIVRFRNCDYHFKHGEVQENALLKLCFKYPSTWSGCLDLWLRTRRSRV